MKKILLGALVVFLMTSCATQIIPRAVNTVNAVSLDELNLSRKDYRLIKTITAEATIEYTELYGGSSIIIKSPEEKFALFYTKKKKGWEYKAVGIVKLGYLANDYKSDTDLMGPEEIARRLAIYRLINQVRLEGADGIIEPVISTNVEQGDRNTIIYKTTVCGKLITLKTDK